MGLGAIVFGDTPGEIGSIPAWEGRKLVDTTWCTGSAGDDAPDMLSWPKEASSGELRTVGLLAAGLRWKLASAVNHWKTVMDRVFLCELASFDCDDDATEV